jgi:membrane-associated phospholipid phosphatase
MNARPFFKRLMLGALTGLVATIAYRTIQFVSIERADIRSTCWSWSKISFSPAWIWPYMSMFILVGLPWFLIPTIRRVKRFALCLLCVAAMGWLFFLLHPTACVRPDQEGQPGYYVALLVLDRPDNCMPCLHAAFSVLAAYALLGTRRFLNGLAANVLLGLWVLLICVSIVALRQHTDVDMIAGAFLGCAGAVAYGWNTASSKRAMPTSECMDFQSGVTTLPRDRPSNEP